MHRALWLVGALAACAGRGDAAFGDRCRSDRDCARGLCVAGVDGDRPVCTISCDRDEACPRGWSCQGVTQSNVLVCARGSAVPFAR